MAAADGAVATLCPQHRHVLLTSVVAQTSAGYGACTSSTDCLCAASLLFIQIILTGWVETKRGMDFQNPGTQDNWLGEGGQFKPMDNGYPGGAFFDPFGLSRGSEAQLRRFQVNASLTLPCLLSDCMLGTAL